MVALRSGWLAVVIALLFLVPAAPTTGPATPAIPEGPAGESIVRIHVAPSDVAGLGPGVEVVEAYDTFVLARASAEAVARLSRRTTVVAEDTYTLHVNGYGFDVRGEVRVPPTLAAAEHTAGSAYYIVQFVGPVKEEWRSHLESLGARVVGYVPNNAFVVRATLAEIQAAGELREAQWIGPYHPAFRIAPDLLEATGTVTVKVITFGEERVGGVVASLSKMGFRVVGRSSDEIGILHWGTYSDFGLVRVRLDASYLVDIARLGAVRYIEPQEEMQLFNQQEQYVLQTNATSEGAGVRKIWDNGLRGDLQVVALSDTGLDYDHTMFRHDQNTVTTGDIYNTTVTTRRKVIRYLTMSQYVGVDPWGTDPGPRKDSPDGFCGSGHGTATSAAAAGFDSTFTPASANDGMAPNAKLVMLDIGRVDATACDDVLAYIPDDYADLFGPAYAAPTNARIFSGSWGGSASSYTTEARMTDTFVWNNPDALILFANGNSPPNALVGSPATNKNGVAVSGAAGIGNREAMGAASVGPTTDGRRKPDITTFYATTSPGGSAISDGDPSTLNAGDGWFGGTSYSTPLAAGMAALARQYFMTGWYPRGVASGGFNMLPSAALLKAVLTAGSVQMTGSGACPGGDAFYPNRNQGWGRLWLDEVLYFAGDAKKLFVVDHPTGLFTGDTVEYKIRLASATGRLRVMLAYSDYPGLEGASPALVNNLDLEVIDPSGTSYKGNVRGPCSQGQSATGGSFDLLNNLEGVIRLQPASGDWRIRIIGANVPYAAQRFGLVVLADLERTYGVVEVDKTHYSHADTMTIKVTDSDATAVSVVVSTPTEPTGETLVLTQVGAASTVWRATIPTNYAVPASGNGRIEVSHLDTITVTYNDGNPPHASVATARAELDSPAVYDVVVTGITNAGATITWKTDKPSDSVVYYGTTPALGTTVSNPVMVMTHSLTITGLTTETLYYYDVGSSYVGGLATRDTNGGAHYRFKTVEKAEILLVLSDLGSLTQERLEMYRAALAGASWAWNEWDVGRQGDPPLATLQDYKVILWQAGLEQYPPMADAHATLLKTYVDNGGRIFFSGHDFAWAACDTASAYYTVPRCNFVTGVMKAGYVADPSTFSLESGVAADPISGAYTGGVTYVPHRSGGAGDEVNGLPAGGTTTNVWRTNSGASPPWDGLKWEATGPNGTAAPSCVWCGTRSRVVSYLYEFTGINFVTGVPNNAQRTDILNKTIVWLLGRAPPVIRVTTPNGGETITTNTLNMVWQRSAGLAAQEIWHSDDAGASWTKDKDVPGANASDPMNIAAWPNGDRYLVRVVGNDSGTPQFKGQDASDLTFRVNRPGGDTLGALVRPGSLRLFPNPARNGELVTFNATVDDRLRGLSVLNSVEYFVQDTQPAGGQYGAGTPMTAISGFDTAVEDVTASEVAPWPGGTFQTIWVHALDTASPTPNWGPFLNRTFLVINGTTGVRPDPPTGFTASLVGGSFADVRLTWAYTGPTVDKFQIYFGSAYDASRVSYALLQDNIAAGATSWDHVGAGSGNANNYFYYVRAVNVAGSADSAEQAAKFTRPMTAGMQLVSIPLVLQDPRVTTTLQTLTFRTARTYVASDGADEWKAWYQAKGNGDFLSVGLGMALWVDVVGPDDFTIAGQVPASTTLTLVGGTWNFVGYGSFIVRAANVAIPGALGATQLEIYAPIPQYYLQRAAMTTNLEPGRGYWVYVTTGGAWTVSN